MNKSIEGDSVLDDHSWVSSELPVTINLSELISWNVSSILACSYEEIASMRDFLEHMYGEEIGKAKYEKILVKYIWNSKSVVSEDDFREFHDVRNNFSLFFSPNFIGDMYRKQPFYQRYATEKPESERYLRKNHNRWEWSVERMKLLYKAYTTMIQYDEVSSNRDLFSLNIAKHIFELNL